jgi:hypothetical protein
VLTKCDSGVSGGNLSGIDFASPGFYLKEPDVGKEFEDTLYNDDLDNRNLLAVPDSLSEAMLSDDSDAKLDHKWRVKLVVNGVKNVVIGNSRSWHGGFWR